VGARGNAVGKLDGLGLKLLGDTLVSLDSRFFPKKGVPF